MREQHAQLWAISLSHSSSTIVMSLSGDDGGMLPGMVLDLVRTSGSMLQAWQLLSSCSAVFVVCVIAGGLMWRMRTEARVVENVQDDVTPPVLQRLHSI